MNMLRAPTSSVMVQVSMVGGSRTRGLLHVPSSTEEGLTPRVARLLNTTARFLPLTPASGSTRDRTVLLQLSQTVTLELDSSVPDEPTVDAALWASVAVPPDAVFQGIIYAALPAMERRLSDALNRAERFIRMRVGQRTLFINAAHITHAIEREPA